ncbi:sigma E protease regulator RseP [Thalassotalea psychrophila]|uniref:Zinc metalloprotease n=1 Tax=Thalassotalea psychrophila TaxID=3065647 RepID=A0ABY9TYR7_9GAMM|nr:sigma E protease regulator RseP [Colwelliaceae bacterium SQ149]
MFEFLWNLGSFIVALGLLVTVHEYGHFWVARKCGVRVEKFSIGFGKTLWRKFDKQGTEYVIALIPLGGYVKMLDERIDDVSEEDKQFAFNQKSVYQRIAIVAAGPIANFLFAIVAFYLMFLIGMTSLKPIIGDITQGSIAEQGEVKANTQIMAINGQETPDWQAVNMALVGKIGEAEINLSTRALDSTYVSNQKLNTVDWQFEPSKTSAMHSLGIEPFLPKTSTIVALLAEGEAGEKSGLIIGDEIISANDVDLYGNWQAFVDIIQQNSNRLVTLIVVRSGDLKKIDMLVGTRQHTDGRNVGYIGVSPKVDPWPESHKLEISYGPIAAMGKAVDSTWNLIVLSFDMIGKLITGHVSVDNLSGPISIAQGAGSSAGIGLVYFLSFLALISINLGIINLLPLPILDGGHLLYYVIELLTGKPVSEKIQEVGFKIGALILLSLMSIAIINDFSRL